MSTLSLAITPVALLLALSASTRLDMSRGVMKDEMSVPLRLKDTTPSALRPLSRAMVRALACTPVSPATPLMAAAMSRAEALSATATVLGVWPLMVRVWAATLLPAAVLVWARPMAPWSAAKMLFAALAPEVTLTISSLAAKVRVPPASWT